MLKKNNKTKKNSCWSISLFIFNMLLDNSVIDESSESRMITNSTYTSTNIIRSDYTTQTRALFLEARTNLNEMINCLRDPAIITHIKNIPTVMNPL